MVCSSGDDLHTSLQTMNFKSFVAPVAALAIVIGGATISAPEAKAEYYNTNRIGNSTYTYGSNGSSYNTNTIGNTTFYNGRTRNGNSYRGSCTSIGNSTFCN